jgi:multiple sugar transport system permease protein
MENLSETQFAYFLLTPALLLLGAIAFWPLLSTFRLSLFADAITGTSTVGEFVGIQNYLAVLTGERNALLPAPFIPTSFSVTAIFGSALTVTLIFTIASVFFETIIGFGQALVLDQDFRGRRWVRRDAGTVSRRFSAERTAPNLGADRDDVALGPTHGVVAVPGDRPP